jgi:hypothetical protein
MPPKWIHIPADPARVELDQIKERQLDRKSIVSAGIGNQGYEALYQMLYDIIENQARTENKLNKLLGK